MVGSPAYPMIDPKINQSGTRKRVSVSAIIQNTILKTSHTASCLWKRTAVRSGHIRMSRLGEKEGLQWWLPVVWSPLGNQTFCDWRTSIILLQCNILLGNTGFWHSYGCSMTQTCTSTPPPQLLVHSEHLAFKIDSALFSCSPSNPRSVT